MELRFNNLTVCGVIWARRILVTEIHFPRLLFPCYVSAHHSLDCEVWRSQSEYTVYVCVCVYIYMCVCVCIYIYIYIYVCVCVCVCVLIYCIVHPDEGLLGLKMLLKITE